jgi:acyl dehydratase
MIASFYEDHRVGQSVTAGSHEFTREAIVAFARAYDPQPFHLDDAAGAASLFGSLCASGWHTASVCMRVLIDYRAAQRAFAMRWANPVRPGAVVTFSAEVQSMRETKRPQWGLIGSRAAGVDQDGREVLSYSSHVLVARRGH